MTICKEKAGRAVQGMSDCLADILQKSPYSNEADAKICGIDA
jgi:hypothetical protein